jgi:cytochrome c553
MSGRKRGLLAGSLAALALWIAAPRGAAEEPDFEARLARVDAALKKNPHRIPAPALDSCLRQRNFAARLYDSNRRARAERSLDYCFQVLKLSEEEVPPPEERVGPTLEEIQARAAEELEAALALEPDLANGLAVYRGCADCHGPEGWGMQSGLVPQIAGQHRTVVIKQLADIRAGNRETVVMAPYAAVEVIGGTQAVADVAGYIDTLEISTAGGKGPGEDLDRGQGLYVELCADCHGVSGEGNPEAFVPRIQAQQYEYLVRQFEWIRDGERRNANPQMQAQIAEMSEGDMQAVLDYVSRLEPPEELQAPPGWRNPDFAR